MIDPEKDISIKNITPHDHKLLGRKGSMYTAYINKQFKFNLTEENISGKVLSNHIRESRENMHDYLYGDIIQGLTELSLISKSLAQSMNDELVVKIDRLLEKVEGK